MGRFSLLILVLVLSACQTYKPITREQELARIEKTTQGRVIDAPIEQYMAPPDLVLSFTEDDTLIDYSANELVMAIRDIPENTKVYIEVSTKESASTDKRIDQIRLFLNPLIGPDQYLIKSDPQIGKHASVWILDDAI